MLRGAGLGVQTSDPGKVRSGQSHAPAGRQHPETLANHGAPPRERQVFDHVLGKHPMECSVGKRKRPGGIEAHNWPAFGEEIRIEPAWETLAAGSEVKFTDRVVTQIAARNDARGAAQHEPAKHSPHHLNNSAQNRHTEKSSGQFPEGVPAEPVWRRWVQGRVAWAVARGARARRRRRPSPARTSDAVILVIQAWSKSHVFQRQHGEHGSGVKRFSLQT